MDKLNLKSPKSRVYICVDEQNRIVQIEGEYSLSNIRDLSSAILLEEGPACDRLNHAQTAYLAKPLLTYDGIYQYKWDGAPVLRSEDEIAADRAARDAKTPAEQREAAYNSDAVIEWGGEAMTVTAAAQQWAYYAAEGDADKTAALSTLIAAAKAEIREKYPDEEVQDDE